MDAPVGGNSHDARQFNCRVVHNNNMRYTEEELKEKQEEAAKALKEQRQKTLAENRQVRWDMKNDEAVEIVEMRATMSIKEIAVLTGKVRQTVSSLEKKGLVHIVDYLKTNRKRRDNENIRRIYEYYEDLLWAYILGNNS